MTEPVTILDYDELAGRLGITRESARRLVIRKRWRRAPGNDGKARVAVPNDALPDVTPSDTSGSAGHDTGDITGSEAPKPPATVTGQQNADVTPPEKPVTGDDTGPVTGILTRHIERLEAEITELRAKASDRDTIAAQVEALRAVLDEVRNERDRWHAAATAPRSWWPWRRSA